MPRVLGFEHPVHRQAAALSKVPLPADLANLIATLGRVTRK